MRHRCHIGSQPVQILLAAFNRILGNRITGRYAGFGHSHFNTGSACVFCQFNFISEPVIDVAFAAIVMVKAQQTGRINHKEHKSVWPIGSIWPMHGKAGFFAHARAIVLGEFPGCNEPGGDHDIRDVLREFFTAGFRGPVLFNFPSGHTAGATWTLPFGVKAEVVTQPSPAVRILEAAVE